MQTTTNYNLPLYEEADAPDLIAGYDDAAEKIDAQMKANADAIATEAAARANADAELQTAIDGKQDKLTLPLSVAQGGTGANAIEGARSNLNTALGASTKTESIGDDTPVTTNLSYNSHGYVTASELKTYVLADVEQGATHITVTVTETTGEATTLVNTSAEAPVKGDVYVIIPDVSASANASGYTLQLGTGVSKPLVRVHDTGEASEIYTGAMSADESYLVFYDGMEMQVLNASPSGGSGDEYVLPAATTTTLGGVLLSASGTVNGAIIGNDSDGKIRVPFATETSGGVITGATQAKINSIESGANKGVVSVSVDDSESALGAITDASGNVELSLSTVPISEGGTGAVTKAGANANILGGLTHGSITDGYAVPTYSVSNGITAYVYGTDLKNYIGIGLVKSSTDATLTVDQLSQLKVSASGIVYLDASSTASADDGSGEEPGLE